MRQYLRAFEPAERVPTFKRERQALPARLLVFDTETNTDLEQRLRVGAYQLRVNGRVVRAGVFYPGATLSEFRKLLERCSVDKDTAVVGFNLPFDIARVAHTFGEARGSMEGGFSFTLSKGSKLRVRVKHLDSRKALINWSGKPRPQGCFVDCATLGKALTGRSHSLKSLAKALGTENQKLDAEHGGEIDETYLTYLRQDVQVTWECYQKLAELWERYKLGHTHISRVYSEASVGKAALREMNVRPFSEVQTGINETHMAAAMETFYGGRSEVKVRRTPTATVYVDFLSMYPTVCTLQGLWAYVTAKHIGVRQSESNTARVARLLREADMSFLWRQENWKLLNSVVRVKPSGDLFPVRSDYSEAGNVSIGLNRLQTTELVWYTLADAVASKLLTGKSPEVVDAITLTHEGQQRDMHEWAVMGNREFMVFPQTGDFYKRIIELRAGTEGDERQALKLVANSTCYGIFAELNARSIRGAERVYYTGSGKMRSYRRKVENPGLYHNPFLATFITGAARLLLATLEKQVTDAGLDWILCDTDSMAIGVSTDSDRRRVSDLVRSYEALNCYGQPIENILKVEYGEHEETQAYAVSAKRYCLFTGPSDTPTIVKASAHGLGHLRSPDGNAKRIAGVPVWLHEVWERLVIADGCKPYRTPFPQNYFPTFPIDAPAMSQFTVTSPGLVRYGMRPYSFASVFTVKANCPWPNRGVAVAPFGTDARETALGAHLVRRDGLDGGTVHISYLATYREILRHYHEHPESKFDGGEERGTSKRRTVVPDNTVYMGKEIADLEAQTHGLADEPKVYGEKVKWVEHSDRERRRIGLDRVPDRYKRRDTEDKP